MSVDLNVSLDSRNLARFRRLMQANRKIAAQSLTFTAERAQEAWRADQAGRFKSRMERGGKTWLDWSIQIEHATQNRLVAKVGSRDKWYERHAIGVGRVKRPEKRNLLVPTESAEQQGTHREFRRQLKSMGRAKTRPLFWRNRMLFRRLGKGHDASIKLLAVLRHSIRIKPREPVEKVVRGAVSAHFPTVYDRLLLKWAASA